MITSSKSTNYIPLVIIISIKNEKKKRKMYELNFEFKQ